MDPETSTTIHYRLKETQTRREWVDDTVCNCPPDQHVLLDWWPKTHAEISIPSCAVRCPYCAFQSRRLRHRGGEIRQHINRVHIDTLAYSGLTVEPCPRGYNIFERLPSEPASEDKTKESPARREDPNTEIEVIVDRPAKRARRNEDSSMKLEKLDMKYRRMREDEELEHSRSCEDNIVKSVREREDNSREYRRKCDDRDFAYAYERAELEREMEAELAIVGDA